MRNVIPPLYAVLILAGFLISATVGAIVVIAGGAVSGMAWSALSRGGGGRGRDRSAARAGRGARRR